MSLPEPYYDRDGITIYCGDCRKIAPQLEYACVVSDPPYGINYNREDVPQGKHAESHRRQTGTIEGDDVPFDPAPWTDVPFILWGANNYASRLPDLPTWLCWDKVTRNGLRLRIAECEFAATNCVARSRVFRFMWSGSYREDERGEHHHPTQKPRALMKWCLALPGLPGGTVLDPFMGSGTTLVAARDLGREAIGIEIEEKYCEIAVKRLNKPRLPFKPKKKKKRPSLFDG